MNKIFLVIAFSWISLMAWTQNIQVVDSESGKGVEKVFIYNKKRNITTETDVRGYFDISLFGSSKQLILKRYGYKEKKVALKSFNEKIILLEPMFIGLEKVVISANKWESNIAEVPNKITALSAKEITYNNPQTMADVMASSGKLFVQKSQMGGGSPMIRGFAANSILLVLDGVRMNNLIYRSGNLQNIITVDANAIESAEVVFGPGSMIYGSDALGGVIDMHTQSPRITGKQNHLSVNALVRYASANHEKTAHVDMNYERGRWGFLTSLSFTDFDDLRMGSHQHDDYQRGIYSHRINGQDTVMQNSQPNLQKQTAYHQFNMMQKVRFRVDDQLNFNYQLMFSNSSDIPRYDRLIQKKGGQLKYATWYYGPQLFLMNSFRMDYTNPTLFFDKLRVNIAHQNLEESRHDRKFGKDFLRSRTERVNTYNLYVDIEKSINEHSFLFYGLEFVANTLTSQGIKKNIITQEEKAIAPRYPDGDNYYQTLGAYVLYKNNLSSHVTLQAGVRYSHINMYSSFGNVNFYQLPFHTITLNTGSTTGNIGMVFRTQHQWSFHLNASSGFRAPNVDDMAKVFDSEPGNVVVPNTNLKPEYAYSTDFTIKKDVGKGSVEATVFYTYLDDAMVRRDFVFNGSDSIMYDGTMSKVSALVNAGHANIYGGSFYGKVLLYPNIMAYGNITFTKGKDDQKNTLRHVAPTFLNAGVSYFTNRLKTDLYVNYNAAIKYEDLALSERKKFHIYALDEHQQPYSPSWWTLNLKSSYQINTFLSVQLGVENILDVRYRPYSSGMVAAGRNFIFSLRSKF